MTTTFTSLPIVDLAPLHAETPSSADLHALANQLYTVFSTVGFAYLKNAPLKDFNEPAVFDLAKDFFALPLEERMKLAKKTFRTQHTNTYRGYFPAQPGADNLKEGFEMGPSTPVPPHSGGGASSSSSAFVLTEPNVFPSTTLFPSRAQTEQLYDSLQSLSATLLQLLAVALGEPADRFTCLLEHSVSTLRLLHYPATSTKEDRLCCTPHTDSGLLTLLHQDATGGLEVRNAAGEWIAAPYIPDTLVVNIGDLMAQMSGKRFVATEHRVRSSGGERYSVPFFCEPGVDAMVGEPGREIRYESFVLGKMGTWIEFQDPPAQNESMGESAAVEMSVGA